VGKITLKTICLASAGLLLPSLAFAAGLGRLTVHSALGEPLRAEIEVVSVQPGEADSLAARLASQEAFRQANIELNSALFEVRFNLERRPDGRHIVVLTSNRPLNEPFVDMLVELTWAGGRLTREYTFLLDPAEYRGPAVAAPADPVTPPTVKPLAAEPARPPQSATAQPAPSAPSAAAAPGAAPAAAAPAKPAAEGASTYEVKRGDTLGRIAQRNLPSGVSLQQMLVALYRSNQDAFVGNNMNRLRAGRILNIPDREAALAVTEADARSTVNTQGAEYAEYQRSIGAAVAATGERPDASRQASGRIEPAAPEKAPAPAAKSGDQVRLSKPDEKGAKGAAVARADDAVAKERALREAQERIAMLEKNIADMKKLQELKSAQGAQLQQQAEAAKGAKPDAGKAAPVPPPAAPKADATKAPAPPTKGEPAKAEPGKAPAAVITDAPKAPEAAKPPPADAGKGAPPVAVAPDAGKAATPPAPDAAKAPEAPKAAEAPKKAPAKAAPPPPPPPSLLDELVDNIYALAGLAIVALLLVAYAVFAWRRKKQASQRRFDSSVMPSLPADQNSVIGTVGGQNVDTGSSALTDFSQAGAKADADEIDPVAEADVYMAYGRDAQAEEILKEALAKDPQRHPVRLKLLEVYANRKDAKSFETHARELHSATGGRGAEWDKAVALGQQIDPANPPYGGGGGGVAAAVAAGAAAGMAAAAAMSSGHDEPSTAPAVDFDLDLGAAPTTAPPDISLDAAAVSPHEQTSPIDFDLDAGTGEKPVEPVHDAAPAGSSIDFDLGMDSTPPAAEEKPAEPEPAAADAGNSMDFDLKLDDFMTTPSTGAAKAEEPAAPAEFDMSSISLDLGSEATQPAPGLDAKWQEVATKLDLAKAYEEMGDKDGARDLLNEVMKEGDTAQQQQAKNMLEALT
jgi:pilus assembly protein FimV